MSEQSADSLDSRITHTRLQLAATLNEIEDRLNVPKQVGKLAARVKSSYKKNPVPWIVGATSVVVVVGGLVAWAFASDD
jgi:hypothetical protein